MAKCPKCGRKLHLYNISQNCPSCGINMKLYGFEDQFFREAKLAELSNAVWHIRVHRLKAAFIGRKLSIVRLVVILLPVAALLVPAGTITLGLPFRSFEIALSGLGLYGAFNDGTLMYLINSGGYTFASGAFAAARTALFAYAGAAVFAVAVLLATILCFVSLKNMQKIIAGIALAGAVEAIAAFFLINRVASVTAAGGLIGSSSGVGSFVIAAAFLAVAGVNIALDRLGVPVELGEGMEERARIYAEYKAGKVKLEDLPQPVVETEATKKISDEIDKARASLIKSLEKEANEVGA
ncbi:MAG: hypothetical protein K6C36_02465 [Clostridia bacterium]|nr:hypothetical protein [Clostridia bacterium]